jgi:hypothetical protein
MEATRPNRPTPSGRLLWPFSDGYLHVKNAARGDAERLACTCSPACMAAECRGSCSCETCTLAWLIYQDERALWNEQGQLVHPEDLAGTRRVALDPRQLKLRFERNAVENSHG